MLLDKPVDMVALSVIFFARQVREFLAVVDIVGPVPAVNDIPAPGLKFIENLKERRRQMV